MDRKNCCSQTNVKNIGNVLLRTGKYTLATFEYVGLASYGITKAGVTEVRRLATAAKKPVKDLAPLTSLSRAMKKIFKKKAGDIESIRTALEHRLAVLEERLLALEQQRAYDPELAESRSKVLEREKLDLLKQLIAINKELRERG